MIERLLTETHLLGMHEKCVSKTRSGGLAITFVNGRRYAVFEQDSDGDVVLTLTDRAQDAEADASVEIGQETAFLERASRFLRSREDEL